MKLKLGAIGILVKNMGVMVEFYQDVIGLNLEWDGGCFTGVQLENGVFINLCERSVMDKDGQFSYTKGINGTMQITFDVEHPSEVDEEFDRLVKAGATPVISPITEVYGLRTCFVADPEGNLIEVCAAVD
ncbi:putative enzyme related to lactoylglutathione lyase [Fontibacillus solani]|uniref:Putative enzyme related to lactoylglutathione lyase n=1 Tax=Fontibacillus solani TaxID=1572857 RepID=A0A7W3SQK9_9BACL|nr:VOC family protein [Fontibacillus solani]MBA9084279.1 putative enzyme related to lactoylglutathione lyase [Fontibacillus solani]